MSVDFVFSVEVRARAERWFILVIVLVSFRHSNEQERPMALTGSSPSEFQREKMVDVRNTAAVAAF